MEKIQPADMQSLGFYRWVMFAVIAVIYFFVYFHRVSTSVIAPDLLAEFQADATVLGLMSSLYFYFYALEQPAVGYLSDRLGPRLVIGLWTLTAACGAFMFALAPTIAWAAAGRALIGFGVGGVYVPALKAFSQWFHRKEFATMTGVLIAVGNIGAIAATTPFAWSSARFGWRSSFLLIGGITLLLGFAALVLLRNPEKATPVIPSENVPEEQDPAPRHPAPTLEVLSSFRFWVLGLVFFGIYGAFMTFQGLWATPFLMSVYSIGKLDASELNMMVPIGFIVGAPVFGWLSDRIFSNKASVLALLLALETLIWIGLTFGAGALGIPGMAATLTIMGAVTGGFTATLWSLVRETTPDRIMGLTSGLLNPAPFFGVALYQLWTGAILDRMGRVNDVFPPEAYREAFLVCLLTTAACFVLTAAVGKRLRS